MENRKTDLVVTGYIFDDDKLLLIHHGKLNKWLPVGGHIEKDEVPDNALIREIKEETGLDIEIVMKDTIQPIGNTSRVLALPFHISIHSVGDHDHCSLFYICKAKNVSSLKINNELKAFNWFSKEDLNKDFIPLDVKNIAMKAFDLINAIASLSNK